MIRRLISNEFQNTWEDAGLAFFEILSRYFPGGTERDHDKSQVRISGLWPEI
jgi:hypothetical protein